MARTSRKNKEAAVSDETIKIYRTAVYLRLSVEDNGKKEAESLENQRKLLVEYVASCPYLELAGVYSDNGFSGTDLERPEFQRMLKDVQEGKIDCIVVKDLSRLGRNYIEAGELLEKIFPFLNVRFIAVNDNYDSGSFGTEEILGATLKNVVNDLYAKDISRKICSALKMKRQKGEYIGSYAPYGYLKDPENKNHLIIDTDASFVVKEIFQLRAAGMGIGAILSILNEKGYPSPGKLRYERGIITNNNKKGEQLLWNRHVLRDILNNVVYIGRLAQGRSASCLYKGIPYHRTEKEDWDLVFNTHEPLISMELWEQVQQVNQQCSKTAKDSFGKYSDIPRRENPYGGLFRCADCGRIIKQVCSYSRDGKRRYYTYKCPQNLELGKKGCSSKKIRAEELDRAVLKAIQKQMELFLDIQKLLQNLDTLQKEKVHRDKIADRLQQLQNDMEKKQRISASLYTDYKNGLLAQEEYIYAKETYQTEIRKLEQEADEIRKIRKKEAAADKGKERWEKLVKAYIHTEGITKDMVEAFIEEIRLFSDNSISIEFKYKDEFEEMLRKCQRDGKEVA